MTKKSIGSGRGSVYNILLKALQTGDKYAYEICKEVEEKTNGDYTLNQQSSYSGLKRLEQRQEITSYWKDSDLGGRRHYYSLTEKGRKRLENSNFSWEDARDQIVGTLFEKSKVDKAIDDVNDDIAEIKKSTISPESEQANIDEVLNRTENLVNNQNQIENKQSQSIENDTETNAIDTKPNADVQSSAVIENTQSQSGQLDDLFSLFSQSSQNINDTKNASNTTEIIDKTTNIEQNTADQSLATIDEAQTNENLSESNENHQAEQESQSSIDNQTSDLFSFSVQSTQDAEKSNQNTPQTQSNETEAIQNLNEFEGQNPSNIQSTEAQQTSTTEYETQSSKISNDLNDDSVQQNENGKSIDVINNSVNSGDSKNNTTIETTSNEPQATLFESARQNDDNIAKINETNSNQSSRTQKNQFDELLKNMQTIIKENQLDNEHFEQTKVHTKQLSKNQDNFDNYRQSHQSSNFMEHAYYEKPSTSYFDEIFGISSNQIENKNNNSPVTFDAQKDESLQQNETQNNDSNVEKSGEVAQNQDNDENSSSKTIEVEEKNDKKQSSIDYTIFGDLVSTQDTIQNETSQNTADEYSQSSYGQEKIDSDHVQNQEETSQQVYSNSNSDENYVSNQNETLDSANSNELQNKQTTTSQSTLEELPYKPMKDNINQTLAPNGYTGSGNDLIYGTNSNYDSNYQSEYVGFNDPYANSEYDRWGDKKQTSQNTTQMDSQSQQNLQAQKAQTKNIVQQQEPNFDAVPTQFDSQYQGINNEIFVPSQVVRYYKKQDERHTNSRYVLINKLNLFATIILGFLLAVFNTVTLVLCKFVFASPKAQIVVCDIIYALIAVAIVLYLAKYIVNKSKRANNIGKTDFVISIAIALVVTIFAIAINIENGMTFKNIGSFFASFAMPIIFSIELLFVHLTKKLLAKSAKFYE